MEDIVLISIPETTIRNIVEQAVKKALNSQAEEKENKKTILDLNGLLEARPFIGSRSTIYKKVSAGLIPHSKSGKRLIFDLHVIDEWLLSNKIKTAAEIEAETEKYLTSRKKRG